MLNLYRKLRAQMAADRFRAAIRSPQGAIDLASIMVGVIVIGIIALVILATVFMVIPWSQDEAAKSNLAAVRTAESVAFVQDGRFVDGPGLLTRDLVTHMDGVGVKPDPEGTCYVSAAQSASGTVWVSHSKTNEAVPYEGIDPAFYNWCVSDISDLINDVGATPPSGYVPLNTCDVPTDEWLIGDAALESYIRTTLEAESALNPGDPLLVSHATHPVWVTFAVTNPAVTSLAGIECITSATGLVLAGTAVTDLAPAEYLDSLEFVGLYGNSALTTAQFTSAMPSGLHDIQVSNNTALETFELHDRSGLTYVSVTDNALLQAVAISNSTSDHIEVLNHPAMATVSIANSAADYLAVDANAVATTVLTNLSGDYLSVSDGSGDTVTASGIDFTNTYIEDATFTGAISISDVSGGGLFVNRLSATNIDWTGVALSESAFIGDVTTHNVTITDFSSTTGGLFVQSGVVLTGDLTVDTVGPTEGVHIGPLTANNVTVANVNGSDDGAGLQMGSVTANAVSISEFYGGPIIVTGNTVSALTADGFAGNGVVFAGNTVAGAMHVSDGSSSQHFVVDANTYDSLGLVNLTAGDAMSLEGLTGPTTLDTLHSDAIVPITFTAGADVTSAASMGLTLSNVTGPDPVHGVQLALNIAATSITDLTPLYSYGDALRSLTVNASVPEQELLDIEAALPYLSGGIQVV